MPRKLDTSVPVKYAVCMHNDCPRAKECLRQIAYHKLLQKNTYLRLINPTRCSLDGECEFYNSSTPTRFARGFSNFKKRMYPEHYDKFSSMMQCHFGRTQYYRRRRGETAIGTEEQELILDVLKQVGVTEKMQFDRYEEAYDWKV